MSADGEVYEVEVSFDEEWGRMAGNPVDRLESRSSTDE